MGWQSRIQRNDCNRTYFISKFLDFLSDFFASSLNLLLTRQEHKDVPFRLILMNGDSSPYGSFNVISLRFFTEIHVDWEHSAWNVETRSPVEVVLEFGGVHCGRHDDQFQVFSLCQNLLNEPEQDISVECTLMGLIENDDRILFEFVVHHGLS